MFIILLINNISPDIFCHGFVNLLAAHKLSLLLIFPVFAMLTITPRGIFLSLQARSGRQLSSLDQNPRNLAWVRRNMVQTLYY